MDQRKENKKGRMRKGGMRMGERRKRNIENIGGRQRGDRDVVGKIECGAVDI